MLKNYFIISLLCLCILGCKSKAREEHEIYIGTISGPESELMEVAKEVAKQKYDLQIKIFEFDDYSMPNIALFEGSIDANMFQHQPFLDIVNQQRNFNLVTIGKMYLYPMAIYSKKYNSLSELPQGAKVGIPNDPSNESRALLLLQDAGLIKLSDSSPLTTTLDKIIENKKNLKFHELIAAQLPRVLEEIDAACINTNFAMAAGLSPADDGLFVESKDSPYVNIVVVRQDEMHYPKFKQLMSVLHSEPVVEKAKELFGDQAIPGW